MLNQIHNISANELLESLPPQSVGAIITDPPYGLAAHEPIAIPRGDRYGKGGTYNRVNEAWDMNIPLDWLDRVQRVLRPGGVVIVFSSKIGRIDIGARCLAMNWRLIEEIIWFKPDAPPNFSGRGMAYTTEIALWFCPDGKNWTYNAKYAKSVNNGNNFRNLWTFYAPRGEERLHPTQKPLALMDRIVRLFTRPDDLVCDTFAGSGTTLVAAKNAGRSYIGCDLEVKYCDIARKRLQDVHELPLFANQEKML